MLPHAEANLPLHQVRLVALAQAERRSEVARQQIHLLDVGQQSLVDGLLVSCSAAANLLLLLRFVSHLFARCECHKKSGGSYLCLLALLEESLLASLLLGLLGGEVLGLSNLLNLLLVYSGQVDLL